MPVPPDLTRIEHQACYLEYRDKYFATEPALQALGSDRVLAILAACDRQVSYCYFMRAGQSYQSERFPARLKNDANTHSVSKP